MKVEKTKIEGLYHITLDLFPDERGSFCEIWQNEKMTALGLPQFYPVQFNIAESKKGALRGIHSEPWEKFIYVTDGEVFAAIADIRPESPSFGSVETFALGQGEALFLPRFVGNSYQALSEHVIYAYLVNAHWSPDVVYRAVRADDPDLAIPWPIPVSESIISDKDRRNPTLRELVPERFNP